MNDLHKRLDNLIRKCGEVSATCPHEKPSIAIRHLLDLHIAEQEGLNPPTPQEWIDAVDRATEALGEIEAMERAIEGGTHDMFGGAE